MHTVRTRPAQLSLGTVLRSVRPIGARTTRTGRLRGRIARGIVASTMALGVIGTTTVLPAAAAAYDVTPSPSRCVGSPTSNVNALAPYVVGTRTTYEWVYWRPVLQRYSASGWVSVAVYPEWIRFPANSINGSYDYYNTKSASFDRDPYGRALGAGFYRMVHNIYWGSTGAQRDVAEPGWCRIW